ncbi:MAG TPA: hypothetical protein DEH25_11165 [Chloroflexi bacterium]|nr:hypothetical protein [Chloroflexota bacterium]
MVGMRTWNLKSGDPGAFILVADARFGATDYVNDQIWGLHLERSEPPSLALRTTFGLRARSLRLFPRFVEGDTAFNDPAAFSSQPVVKRFHPNYLLVAFSPLMGIDVEIEYWVPDSHSVTGRIKITNSRLSVRQLRFEWVALLRPSGDGQPMAACEINGVTVLCGKTDGITPVVFMSGAPGVSAGPYPALTIDLDLAPGGTRQFIWAQAGLAGADESFALAKEQANNNWEALLARLDIINGRVLEIETGNPDWDAALALTQKNALSMFVGPTEQLRECSFVLSRLPDQGFSPRGNGSDYTHLWNGQSVMDADYLISLILPSAPEFAKGLLENYLSTQTQKGFIDWKPGLGGQRGRMLATPLIVNMAWRIYEATEDRAFLEKIFPNLVSFVQAWFTPEQDRDGDGLPEWSHPLQSGYEDHPAFSQWQAWSQGADITQAESPALCAFLYHEIQLLIRMARDIEQPGPISAMESLADNLKSAVETSWDESNNIYRYWDRESHHCNIGDFLGSRQGPGEVYLQRDFEQPVRVLIQIQSAEERSRPANIFIHGMGTSERHRVENIAEERVQWYLGRGNVTSERVYQHLEHIEISGVEPEDQVTLRGVDLTVQDQTLLLPLWAGIPEKSRAGKLVNHTITDEVRFWHRFGIPSFVQYYAEDHPEACYDISLIWNNLIGEGLLQYGYVDEAVILFTRLMEAIVDSLKQHQSFYQHYHSQNGKGSGERDSLQGLVPIGLFLKILGVRVLSSRRVMLQGHNPFPMPITIKYRGLTIHREAKQTKITFPGGQTAVVRNPKPRIVTVEE